MKAMLWKAAKAACVGVLVLMVGCGGGGGSDDPDISVSFGPTSLSIVGEEQRTSSGTVTATLSGTGSGYVYYRVAVEGEGIDDFDFQQGSDGEVSKFHFITSASLVEGVYAGRLLLEACFDRECHRHLQGSPVTVPYTLVVKHGLRVSPLALQFNAVSGEAPAVQNVTVQLPEGVTAYSATSTVPWAQVVDTTSGSFSVQVDSIPSGNRGGEVQIFADGRTTSVYIGYLVESPLSGEHDLILGADSISLQVVAGTRGDPFLLTANPPTWNPTVTTSVCRPLPGQNFGLEVQPAEGGYTVVADASAAPPGAYTTCVRFHYANAEPGGAVREVPVSLTVLSAP